MNSTIAISVVIPVYNAAPYLEECLKSVEAACGALEEKCGHCGEVICIDDGSTDGSGEILDRYAGGHLRVRVLHKGNGGVSSARNIGIGMARGEWVHFVDADDWVEESLYTDLAGWIDRYPKADSLVFGAVELDQHGRIVRKWGEGRAPAEMTGDELLGNERYGIFAGCIWNKIYKREVLLRACLLFDVKMQAGEDNTFSMMFLTYCQKVIVRPEIFGYYYRATPNSCIHTLTTKKLLSAVDQFLHLHDRWQKIRTSGLGWQVLKCARVLLFIGKDASPQIRRECVEALVRGKVFRNTAIPYLWRYGMMKDRIFSMAYCFMPQKIRRLLLESL